MLIIVEGPDGAGKTRLCDELEVRIRTRFHAIDSVVRISAGPPTRHPLDEYELSLLPYRPTDRYVICDRWHIGEYVYPAVLGRCTSWNAAVGRHISMFLRSRGALVVLLNPPMQTLVDRVNLRGDDLVHVNQLAEISARYASLPIELRPDLRYEYSSPNADTVINTAMFAESTAFPLSQFVTYVGPPRPQLLLLGDTRGTDDARARLSRDPESLAARVNRRSPAFMPYPSTCGAFMLQYLGTSDVGLANACDVDDPALLVKVLKPERVVTLGRNAHRRLNELGVPHGTVPHPQYIRRFHHHAGLQYAQLIDVAANGRKDMLSWRP